MWYVQDPSSTNWSCRIWSVASSCFDSSCNLVWGADFNLRARRSLVRVLHFFVLCFIKRTTELCTCLIKQERGDRVDCLSLSQRCFALTLNRVWSFCLYARIRAYAAQEYRIIPFKTSYQQVFSIQEPQMANHPTNYLWIPLNSLLGSISLDGIPVDVVWRAVIRKSNGYVHCSGATWAVAVELLRLFGEKWTRRQVPSENYANGHGASEIGGDYQRSLQSWVRNGCTHQRSARGRLRTDMETRRIGHSFIFAGMDEDAWLEWEQGSVSRTWNGY